MSGAPGPWGRRRGVVIVDDHPIVRQGLRGVIAAEHDLDVVGEAAEATEALRLLRETKPAAAVIDISLKGSDGLELTKAVRSEHPELPILIMSMHDESIYAERALRAGASGYVMKQAVAENLVEALRLVLKGGVYLSERMRCQYPPRFGGKRFGVACLSDRELEVFRLIGRGRSTRLIAGDLHISVKTVETHRAHIKVKLEIETSPELTRRAVQWVEKEDGPTPGEA